MLLVSTHQVTFDYSNKNKNNNINKSNYSNNNNNIYNNTNIQAKRAFFCLAKVSQEQEL